jgi:signal transduction histidine kinase
MMFNSIFQKLLFTYAAIIILVVLLLAALLTFFFKVYLFEQKQTQLLEAGRQVEALVRDNNLQKKDRDDLLQAVNALGAVTDSRIYILIDRKLAGIRALDGQFQEDCEEAGLVDDIRRIMDGETIVRKNEFSNQLNMYVVFVGMPISINNTANGVALLFSPLDQINKTLFEVYRIIWSTVLASLALAAVIVYILSRRLSTPIENIQKAAAGIAEGNYHGDVEPVGSDEVAQLTRTFNYMQNRLKQVEEMRKDLIANVSHELRTPLTTVRGFIQAILDGVIGPDEQEKYLRRAYDEAGRLNRLVNDLLQLARLQAGSIKLSRGLVDAGELIRETVEELQLQAGRRNVVLRCVCADSTAIQADRDKLKQIVLNLLHNAVNYSRDGGEVWIRTRVEDGKFLLRVEDNGAGIPADQLEYIFEKYHRVENPEGQWEPGTGLGLSIVKQLVELHGGAISASSSVGRGTQIFVEIPSQGMNETG